MSLREIDDITLEAFKNALHRWLNQKELIYGGLTMAEDTSFSEKEVVINEKKGVLTGDNVLEVGKDNIYLDVDGAKIKKGESIKGIETTVKDDKALERIQDSLETAAKVSVETKRGVKEEVQNISIKG